MEQQAPAPQGEGQDWLERWSERHPGLALCVLAGLMCALFPDARGLVSRPMEAAGVPRVVAFLASVATPPSVAVFAGWVAGFPLRLAWKRRGALVIAGHVFFWVGLAGWAVSRFVDDPAGYVRSMVLGLAACIAVSVALRVLSGR